MIIVITGVTRGLGRAMALRFLDAGHIVLGCGRDFSAIEELRRMCTGTRDFDTVDIADWTQVEAWASRLIGTWGPPDYLVNNAGLINRNAPLWEVPPEEFSAVVDVNLEGTANTIRAFAPSMVGRKTGVIVNFSSGWGRSVSPDVAPYCATKWAIEGMTRALAQELPLGMAAVSLNPGVVDTGMLRSCLPDTASRCPDPDQWAQRAVPFLLRIEAADNGSALTAP